MVAQRAGQARLAALIVEALDCIATPGARYEVIDRALLLAQRDALPAAPDELLQFVDGPLHQAVVALLGVDAANLMQEHLGVLIARAGYETDPTPTPSGTRTLRPTSGRPGVAGAKDGRPTSDVVPSSSGRRPSEPRSSEARSSDKASGAYETPMVIHDRARGEIRHHTLSYNPAVLLRETERQRVVVVDDDPHYRRALVRLLDACGYEVNGAPNGDTALWMCEKLQPDLVVTDYELGDTNGLQLADEINRRMGAAAPPIILVTASAVLPKQQAGVARVMVKSVDDGALAEAAAELLRARAR